MEENVITRQEHEEFAKRIDAENSRQNRRLSALEDNIKEIHELTLSVGKMAVNMENMLTAIERQGNLIESQNNRIEKIEKEPADNYKKIKTTIITSIIGTIVGIVIGSMITIF